MRTARLLEGVQRLVVLEAAPEDEETGGAQLGAEFAVEQRRGLRGDFREASVDLWGWGCDGLG